MSEFRDQVRDPSSRCFFIVLSAAVFEMLVKRAAALVVVVVLVWGTLCVNIISSDP